MECFDIIIAIFMKFAINMFIIILGGGDCRLIKQMIV